MSQDLIVAFLFLMETDRRGQIVDFVTMKHFVKFLCNIETGYSENLYTQQLETLIIDSTIKYYSSSIQEILNTNDYTVYLKIGSNILISEEQRLNAYIPNNTVHKIITNLKQLIFFDHSKLLLENGFSKLLYDQNISVIIIT